VWEVLPPGRKEKELRKEVSLRNFFSHFLSGKISSAIANLQWFNLQSSALSKLRRI